MYYHTTHFFDKLLNGDERYNFKEVRDWSQRIVGDLVAMEDLIVPINSSNQH